MRRKINVFSVLLLAVSLFSGCGVSSADVVPKENVEFPSTYEYSCAMKSHFRKFGNQMSGSGNHLCKYTSLLA